MTAADQQLSPFCCHKRANLQAARAKQTLTGKQLSNTPMQGHPNNSGTPTCLHPSTIGRWREAQAPKGGELWVGALLEAVEVDDWGKFKFVLVRLRDHTGKQKLLVRGSNYSSEGKLVEALHRQVSGRAVPSVRSLGWMKEMRAAVHPCAVGQ